MLRILREEEVFVLGAARTPTGAFDGVLREHRAVELGAAALEAAIGRAGLPPEAVEMVVMGNVVGAGLGQNPAKQAAVGAGCPHSVHALLVNTVCAAGMAAIVEGLLAILAGAAGTVAAGGMESRTNAPYLLGPFDRRRRRIRGEVRGDNFCLEFPPPEAGADEYRAFVKSLRAAVLKEANTAEALVCPFNPGVSMKDYGVRYARRRGWDAAFVDRYAAGSYEKAMRAQAEGAFAEEITAVGGVSRDEIADPGLQRALREKSDSPVSSYNAPSLADGAAAVVLAAGGRARELGARPLARVLGFCRLDVPPEEFIEAPVRATRMLMEALAAAGLADGFDIFEGNESFGLQIPLFQEGVPIERQNVHGGAVALRHPLGASGARIVVTLLHAMRRYGLRRGIAAICFASGGAFALALERVE